MPLHEETVQMVILLAMGLAAAVADPVDFSTTSQDGYLLHGELDKPEGQSIGAVVMISGTGPFDRDMRLGRSGTERDAVFKDLGSRFAAHGLTSVRYDRRAVIHGAAPGQAVDVSAVPTVTAENLSLDAQAVYDWTRSEEGLGAKCVVVFAHSEGSVHLAGLAKRNVQP
ncbi:hypothetical protein LTR94_024779, partial [Friedmanniomyces endolithicus]